MKEIIIRIKSELPSEPSPDASTSTTAPKPTSDANGKSNTSSMYINSNRLSAAYITKNVVQSIVQEAEYLYGRYDEIAEDYKGQTNVKNTMKTISLVVGLSVSMAAGAKIGGPIGAIVGLVTGATAKTISAVNNVEGQIEQIHEQAYSNYFQSVRAGYADGSQGTEN